MDAIKVPFGDGTEPFAAIIQEERGRQRVQTTVTALIDKKPLFVPLKTEENFMLNIPVWTATASWGSGSYLVENRRVDGGF